MKWFKHENTFNSPKIELLTESWGIEGYGVYFSLLELIASHIETDNQIEWGYLPKEYSLTYLSKKLHIDEEKLTNIISECVTLSLFEDRDGRIFCPKILERCDDYTNRIIKQSNTKLEQTSNKVEKSLPRIEEEKNRKEKEKNNILAEKPQVPSPVKKYERKAPDKQTQLQRIGYFLEDTLKTTIVNWGKQAKALDMMLKAGYREEQILFAIKYMANDEFYDDKGFDLMTVANGIDKLKAKMRKGT